MFLIGLNGQIGSGKSEVANMICDYYKENYICQMYRFAFADELKTLCVKVLGLKASDVYTQEGKAKFNKFWGMTNREILQRIGTECFRKGFCDDFWCKLMQRKLQQFIDRYENRTPCYTRDIIIIDDVRFPNEAELIRSLGGKVIRIVRPTNKIKNVGIKNHASEQILDDHLVNTEIINDGTLDDLSVNTIKALKRVRLGNPEKMR